MSISQANIFPAKMCYKPKIVFVKYGFHVVLFLILKFPLLKSDPNFLNPNYLEAKGF